jgi:hypothetical protein
VNDLEPDQLATLIAAKLQNGNGSTPPLLNAGEAGSLLKMPPTWLLSEARANRVPHVRMGKYVPFKRADLLEWVDGRSSGPRRRS